MRLLGRLWWLIQALLPQFWLGSVAKALARSRWPRLKNGLIRYWIGWYRVDMDEALEADPEIYPRFVDFFARRLQPHLRSFPSDKQVLASPADGRLMQFGTVREQWLIQAKGRSYKLQALLGSQELAQRFEGCDYACIYLSPRDYHRIHMPLSGQLMSTARLPGRLFSVGPLSALGVPQLYAGNRRCCCLFETPHGPMAVVLVGALMVGEVHLAWERVASSGKDDWQGSLKVDRGAEIGRFELGSAVVLVAPPRYRLLQNLKPGIALKVGEALARTKDD